MQALCAELAERVVAPCEPRAVTRREYEDGVLPCTPLRFRAPSGAVRHFNWRNHERLEACCQTLERAGLNYAAAINFAVFGPENTPVAFVPRNFFFSSNLIQQQKEDRGA